MIHHFGSSIIHFLSPSDTGYPVPLTRPWIVHGILHFVLRSCNSGFLNFGSLGIPPPPVPLEYGEKGIMMLGCRANKTHENGVGPHRPPCCHASLCCADVRNGS